MDTTMIWVALLGLGCGAIVTWMACVPTARAREIALVTERDLLAERVTDLESAAAQDRELVATLGPLTSTLQQVEHQVHTLERDRVEQYARLTEQLETMRRSGEGLRQQTASLANALRAPSARGTWGEVQLRRVVEHAGMLARVDFTAQATATNAEGGVVRPDLVVHLPGGKNMVIDAKAPLAALLAATESTDDEEAWARAQGAHAAALRAHVRTLADKKYWQSFEPCPELVVCFVPSESLLATACRADPRLLDDALASRVVLATPNTLLAVLRTVALTWQSESLSAGAQEVLTLGRQLYERLSTLGGATTRLGRSLERAVDDYNTLVGTLERRVLVSARRLHDLGMTDDPLISATPVTLQVRHVAATELTATLGQDLASAS